ncbi:MAG: hypothetical protein F6J97_11705 [Leptolyngbya sp. SIO4C1]|nr:hypothetical protein [Leptolyngbya sp. SIO4C1]
MALAAGCDDYVRKPFREYEILEKISQYLDVHYRYEGEAANGAFNADVPQPLTHELDQAEIAARLSAMPELWLSQLHQAATQLDREDVSELVQQISDTHSALAEQLQSWANSFRFDKITDHTGSILEIF